MSLVQTLKAMGLKVNPQMEAAFQKAQEVAGKYGNSREGLIKAIEDNGGQEALNKALQSLNNPMVAGVLTALGYPPDKIKAALSNLENVPQQTNNALPNSNLYGDVKNLQDRLSKLK